MLIFGTGEQVDQVSQDREHRRLSTAALLREAPLRFFDLTRNTVGFSPFNKGGGEIGEVPRNRRDENSASLVQRFDRKSAALCRKDKRRVDKPHVPARVAAGKLEARRKQHAAPLIERFGKCRVGRLIVASADLAGNMDAALGNVALPHGISSGPRRLGRSGRFRSGMAKAARSSLGGLQSKQCRWPPLLHGPPPDRCVRKLHGTHLAALWAHRNLILRSDRTPPRLDRIPSAG